MSPKAGMPCILMVKDNQEGNLIRTKTYHQLELEAHSLTFGMNYGMRGQ